MAKTPSPHTQVITIQPDNPEHMKMFEQTFMKEGCLYERQFPDAGEREDPSETLEYMKDGSGVVSIMVRTEPNSKEQVPVGFAYANIFDVTNKETGKDGSGVLVAYIAKDKEKEISTGEHFDAKMILERMLTDMSQTMEKPVEGLYWEANRPDRYALNGENGLRHDSMDPQQRLDIVQQKYGFGMSGLDYQAPPLNGEEADPDMHLLAGNISFKNGSVKIEPNQLNTPEQIGALQGFLSAYYEDMEVPDHPALQEQLGALEDRKDSLRSRQQPSESQLLESVREAAREAATQAREIAAGQREGSGSAYAKDIPDRSISR